MKGFNKYLAKYLDDFCKFNSATTKRSLDGFMARTFVIEKLDRSPGGLLFKHNKDGTQTVINGADVLYDYTKEDTPILDLGSK